MNDVINGFAEFLQSEDISKIDVEDIPVTAIAAITGGPVEKVIFSAEMAKTVFQLPNYFFWRKMGRLLKGTFLDSEDGIRLAAKFDPESEDYISFIEHLIHMVNQVENSDKVDWYANLTRAWLITNMDLDLYYKLAKFLTLCTVSELSYIKEFSYNNQSINTTRVSALYQFGLFTQITVEGGETRYILSDFAKALKQNCLNFDEGLKGQERLSSYEALQPLELVETATADELERALYGGIHYEDENNDGNVRISFGRK